MNISPSGTADHGTIVLCTYLCSQQPPSYSCTYLSFLGSHIPYRWPESLRKGQDPRALKHLQQTLQSLDAFAEAQSIPGPPYDICIRDIVETGRLAGGAGIFGNMSVFRGGYAHSAL